jgi:hypothetical protein
LELIRRRRHFIQHGRTDAVGFCALAYTVMGRNQTNFFVHPCQLRECISFGWVRNICDHSDTIQDCKRPFASLTSSCCCYDLPLPVITFFCPDMSLVLRKRPTRRRILVGWKRLASHQWKSSKSLIGRKQNRSSCALLNQCTI